MPPVMVPTVQVNVLGTVEIRAMLGLAPLQIIAVFEVVITGAGLTVNVMVKGAPTHAPIEDVGVTI